MIAETDVVGNTVREYIWLLKDQSNIGLGTQGTALPLATVADVSTTPLLYHVHTDHLNRPIMMTDGAKTEVWAASYLPYGAADLIAGSAAHDARFPGQWFQLESGLAYNWHRHYDATLGRYTQADPLGFVNGPSQYAYALNSPQMFVDKIGREAIIGSFAGMDPARATSGGILFAGSVTLSPLAPLTCAAFPEFCRRAITQCFNALFKKRALLNNNNFLRIGESFHRPGGPGTPLHRFFSVRGKIVDKLMGKPRSHKDFKDLGPVK